jgi:hypothetical protein
MSDGFDCTGIWRAGTYPAINAAALRSKIIPTNVAGSVGSVPNKRVAIHLATAKAAMVPTMIPPSTSRIVLAITPSCTFSVVAPNAMGMPIAYVCRVTGYEMTP